MYKKIFFIAAAVLVFGLTIAAYAITAAFTSEDGAASVSCCKGDACPMKKKDASPGKNASGSDGCTCCKEGECPMGSAVHAAKAGDGECCKMKKAHTAGSTMKMAEGEACPMMKNSSKKIAADGIHQMPKDAQHKEGAGAKHEMKGEHANCGCPCCGHNEKKTDAAI